MKHLKIILPFIIGGLFIFSSAFAAGNIEKGKYLFNDPKAFGAPGETSCNSCHPGGKGLEKAGAAGRKYWTPPGGKFPSLEDAINFCIKMANKGQPVDPKSEEMKDMVAYIKSLSVKKK